MAAMLRNQLMNEDCGSEAPAAPGISSALRELFEAVQVSSNLSFDLESALGSGSAEAQGKSVDPLSLCGSIEQMAVQLRLANQRVRQSISLIAN